MSPLTATNKMEDARKSFQEMKKRLAPYLGGGRKVQPARTVEKWKPASGSKKLKSMDFSLDK